MSRSTVQIRSLAPFLCPGLASEPRFRGFSVLGARNPLAPIGSGVIPYETHPKTHPVLSSRSPTVLTRGSRALPMAVAGQLNCYRLPTARLPIGRATGPCPGDERRQRSRLQGASWSRAWSTMAPGAVSSPRCRRMRFQTREGPRRYLGGHSSGGRGLAGGVRHPSRSKAFCGHSRVGRTRSAAPADSARGRASGGGLRRPA